jgi:hypothetical protein
MRNIELLLVLPHNLVDMLPLLFLEHLRRVERLELSRRDAGLEHVIELLESAAAKLGQEPEDKDAPEMSAMSGSETHETTENAIQRKAILPPRFPYAASWTVH